LFEHAADWPGTLALFYDSREYEESFMRLMAVRLMDIFTDSNRKNFEKPSITRRATVLKAIHRESIKIQEMND